MNEREKPALPPLVSPQAEAYAAAHTTPESAVLHHIYRWGHLNLPQPRMMAGAYQGQLLRQLSLLLRPRVVVEVGSYVGYSTICLAEGMATEGEEPAILHAIEVDEEREEDIRRHLAMAGMTHRVQLHIGDALHVLPAITEPIDLAFIDADKRHTHDYYELLLPKLRQNALLVIDNTLWGGKVLENISLNQAEEALIPKGATSRKEDIDTQMLKAFNDHVLHDPRVDTILLPLRDGLTLCRKR